jgi:hypothetical protein
MAANAYTAPRLPKATRRFSAFLNRSILSRHQYPKLRLRLESRKENTVRALVFSPFRLLANEYRSSQPNILCRVHYSQGSYVVDRPDSTSIRCPEACKISLNSPVVTRSANASKLWLKLNFHQRRRNRLGSLYGETLLFSLECGKPAEMRVSVAKSSRRANRV